MLVMLINFDQLSRRCLTDFFTERFSVFPITYVVGRHFEITLMYTGDYNMIRNISNKQESDDLVN